jgi:hypothetical protein
VLTRLDRSSIAAVRAFMRVRNDTAVAGFLGEELAAVKDSLVLCTAEVAMRQLQGRAQVLQELLDLIENSVKTAEKLGA